MRKPFNPPLTPEECERGKLSVGKIVNRHSKITEYECEDFENIPEGEWWLLKKQEIGGYALSLTFRTSNGYVIENYGKARMRQYSLDKNHEPIRDAEKWAEKGWYIDEPDGGMDFRRRNVSTETEEDRERLKESIIKNEGTLEVFQQFNRRGWVTLGMYYRIINGEILLTERVEKEDMSYMHSLDLDGIEYAPKNEPSYFYHVPGKLKYRYKMYPGIYHRDYGPALFNSSEPEESVERYFLEGKEYSKSEWYAKRNPSKLYMFS